MPPLVSARDAALALGRYGRVLIAGCAAEPTALLDVVAEDSDIWAGLCLTGAFIPGVNETDYTALVPGGRVEAIFTTQALAGDNPAVAHLPLHYSAYWARLARPGVVGAAVMTVPPPRADGTVGYGLACDFLPAAIGTGAPLIGVINPHMPDVPHGPRLSQDRFLAFVEDDSPLRELGAAPGDETTARIAQNVVSLLRDGDTLQLGLGRLQSAILDALIQQGSPARLGYHAGMISPGILAPGLFPGGTTTGVALGDAAFYADVAVVDNIRFAPVGHTHAVGTLAALPSLVSVNSALAVDLSGQVSAEYLGRQFSGQGGMVDFIRGARASVGGRSIIALPASLRGGSESRIISRLGPGIPVSVARADVDIVVTEYGIADLREADLRERAARLTAIAAPQFRDDLMQSLRGEKKG